MDANNYRIRYHLRSFVIIVFATLSLTCAAPDQTSKSKPVSHDLWSEVLNKIVNEDGSVNYKSLKKDISDFHQYLKILENNHPDYQTWSRNDRLAYWINAYNAFTVQLIIENYPLESIKDLNSIFSVPFVNTIWDKSFINIEEQSYSLNDIEHKILRKKFNEPRIHFAINCASVSCPNLRREAFNAEDLDKQLFEQAETFINDDSKNKIEFDKVKISKIFNWFGSDFKENGNLIDYLNKYSKIAIDKKADISFMDYNWSLND